MSEEWIIESRDPDGKLNLNQPQPWTFFGMRSVRGITSDEMAKHIFRQVPEAMLDGREIAVWPKRINPNWIARRKTW